MFDKLNELSENRFYWLTLALICVLLEAAALFYQYVLNYGPCILCIHVRIIVMGMLLVSLLGLFFRQRYVARLSTNIMMMVLLGVLLERSYMLLGIERGFVTGSCGFESGLPAWFSVDQWLPFMFAIWESCGYTPVLLFGITMAEALLVISAVWLLISVLMTFSVLREKLLSH